mmetsp:Transcript_26279/g.56354  ORF Transcript_26279/g.56354 Transcript_26279/m.56354 type:complete len:220 (-) Transcript_26279:466-1125(-)
MNTSKDSEGGGDSENNEQNSTDDSNDLFGQVFRQNGTSRNGNPGCDGVSSNRSGGDTGGILCCGESNGRQERSVAEFCCENQTENAQNSGNYRLLLCGITCFNFFFGFGKFFVHNAFSFFHGECFLQGFESKEGKGQHRGNIIQRQTAQNTFPESRGHSMETLTNDHGNQCHDKEGAHGPQKRNKFGSFHSEQSCHEEGFVTNLTDENQGEGLVKSSFR